VCSLYTRVIGGSETDKCAVSAKDPALVMRFPCAQLNNTSLEVSGPSLNLWLRGSSE
jgi:hypothetical protein